VKKYHLIRRNGAASNRLSIFLPEFKVSGEVSFIVGCISESRMDHSIGYEITDYVPQVIIFVVYIVIFDW
jgi:hypothetical protein